MTTDEKLTCIIRFFTVYLMQLGNPIRARPVHTRQYEPRILFGNLNLSDTLFTQLWFPLIFQQPTTPWWFQFIKPVRATSMRKYFVIKGLVFTFTQQISGVNTSPVNKKNEISLTFDRMKLKTSDFINSVLPSNWLFTNCPDWPVSRRCTENVLEYFDDFQKEEIPFTHWNSVTLYFWVLQLHFVKFHKQPNLCFSDKTLDFL